MQTFSEECHQVVLKVHTNILRLGVQDVLLLLAENLNVLLRLCLLLLLDHLLELLFLLPLRHLLQSDRSLMNFVLFATNCLLIGVVGHVVERFLVLLA